MIHDILKIGKLLGIEEKELKSLLKNKKHDGKVENLNPFDTYKGGYYGTISIKDF